MIQERTFNSKTLQRMLNFMYHGEYDVYTDEAPTKLDVLAHLFCYAIGERYMIKSLSDYALTKFGNALRAVTSKDFAELVGVIASNTEATPIHSSIRNVAISRLDELAESKSFVNTMSGKHLTLTLEQKDDDGGEAVYKNLQAAIQLATLSAYMFRFANLTKARTASENARLLRRLEDTQETVELFRKQIIKSTKSLHNSENVHGTAAEAIQAAQKEAYDAKKELFKVASHSYLMSQDLQSTKSKLAEVEEQVISTTQALEKAEVELEILENEDRNNGRALEGLSESMAAAELSLKQREQQLAASLSRGQAEVNHMVSTSKGEQRKANALQHQADEKEKKAVQQQEKYKNLQSQLQGMYEQTKRQLDEAKEHVAAARAQAVEQQRRHAIWQAEVQDQARRDLAEANQRAQRALAEKQVFLEQLEGKSAAPLSQVVEQQKEDARSQLQSENKALLGQDKEDSAATLKQAVDQQRETTTLRIQDELSQAKRELVEATQVTQRVLTENQVLRERAKEHSAASSDQIVEQQRELAVLQIQGELSQAKHELAQVNQETQRLMAEAKALHDQGKENTAIVLSQAPLNLMPSKQLSLQEKTFHAQQANALYHHTQHLHAVQSELNKANLDNFIMKRRIDDLENIILTGSCGGQTAPGF